MGMAASKPTPVVVGTPVAESKPADAGKSAEGPKLLDLVFTMDVTGSMGSYIQAAKQNIEAIVRQLATQNIDLRFGLVAYRDHPPATAPSRSALPLARLAAFVYIS